MYNFVIRARVSIPVEISEMEVRNILNIPNYKELEEDDYYNAAIAFSADLVKEKAEECDMCFEDFELDVDS